MLQLSLPEVRRQCQVCGSLKRVSFSYGVDLCNACKQFYRRSIIEEKQMASIVCKHIGNVLTRNCRACRYMKCKSVIPLERCRFFDDRFPFLLNELEAKNRMRSHLFLNKVSAGGVIAENVISRKNVMFCSKEMKERTAHDWANHQMLTTMEYMKTFSFVHQLSDEDAEVFIKKKYFDCGIFFMAMESFENHKEIMLFPGNKDVFPEESGELQMIFPGLFNRIRSKLISRFRRLKITKKELLLLSVIICSDSTGNTPDGKELSSDGKELIRKYQDMHRQALLKSCLLSHQKNGPARFGNLLTIIHLVSKTMHYLSITLALFRIYGVPMKKLIEGYFEDSDLLGL